MCGCAWVGVGRCMRLSFSGVNQPCVTTFVMFMIDESLLGLAKVGEETRCLLGYTGGTLYIPRLRG